MPEEPTPTPDTVFDSSAFNETEIDEAIANVNETQIDDVLADNGLSRGSEINQTTVIMLMKASNQTFTCKSMLLPTPMQNASSWASVGCVKGFYCEFIWNTVLFHYYMRCGESEGYHFRRYFRGLHAAQGRLPLEPSLDPAHFLNAAYT
jgi:hypothetical protein